MTTHTHIHVMDERESVFWHHCNPDIRRWFMGKLADRIAAALEGEGVVAFHVYDGDEKHVGSGVAG